jgi:tRNA-intron endonuclease
MTALQGNLIENRIIVWDIQQARDLFGSGYYGKPMGIPKPKGTDFDAPLILDLIEGCYLVEVERLDVRRVDGDRVTLREIRNICRKEYGDFDMKYIVFRDLRNKGYVVSPGIKFGCDFAVYEHGPGIDHAPYLVQVLKMDDYLTATAIVLAGRLATTVKKQFILAIPYVKDKRIDFIGFDWWRA